MKLLPFKEEVSVDNIGSVILHYGKTGVGKSASALATLEAIIIFLCMERRDANRAALAVGRNPKDYRIGVFTDWRELLEFLNNFEEKIKEAWGLDLNQINSVVIDGLTHLMINLSTEMENQIHEAQDEKSRKSLIAETKLSQEGYGALPKQMVRAMESLCKLAQQNGKVIVLNALLEEQENKWDNTFSAEPSLEGRKFGRQLPGMCDLIGLVEPRYRRVKITEGGEEKIVSRPVFPPRVKYEKEEWENFTCKWTGERLQNPKDPDALIQPPLDFNIILGLNRKERNNVIDKPKKNKTEQPIELVIEKEDNTEEEKFVEEPKKPKKKVDIKAWV